MEKATYNKVTSKFYYYGREVIRALMDAMKEVDSVTFRDPVHAPALDDDGYYQYNNDRIYRMERRRILGSY